MHTNSIDMWSETSSTQPRRSTSSEVGNASLILEDYDFEPQHLVPFANDQTQQSAFRDASRDVWMSTEGMASGFSQSPQQPKRVSNKQSPTRADDSNHHAVLSSIADFVDLSQGITYPPEEPVAEITNSMATLWN
jgi:hypothetical protein